MKNFKIIGFYIILFLFCLGFASTAGLYDFDLWARLIAGMSVVETGHVLKNDFLSYTPTHTWFDHEWGSGVIFYLVQKFFSQTGLVILLAFLIFATFFFIIQSIKLRGTKTTTAYNFLFYFFAFQAASQIMNNPVRCQMFSFLLFSIFLFILELARQNKNKPLILLPLLMIIWNNLHGGCVSGLGLIGIYAVGEFLNGAPFKKYLIALGASIAVLPINPWGFEYLRFLLSAVTMKRPDVTEWWGLFSKFHMFGFLKFKIFAIVILVSEFILANTQKPFKNDKTKLLLLCTTLYLAVSHVRMIPFFVISAAVFIYDDFYTVFNSATKDFFNKHYLVKNALIYSLITLFAIGNIAQNKLDLNLNAQTYPFREVEFIKINDLKGKLFVNFSFGSYAAYKLYPNNLIYMDGRYEEVYDTELLQLMKNFYLLKPNWDELLKKYPPDVMIIDKYYPVYQTLLKDKNWTQVYEGLAFSVFTKASDAKTSYKQPSNTMKYYKKTLFDTDVRFMLKSRA